MVILSRPSKRWRSWLALSSAHSINSFMTVRNRRSCRISLSVSRRMTSPGAASVKMHAFSASSADCWAKWKMVIASSFFTWPRKWPTASPAIGLPRLSLFCPTRTQGKGRAYPLCGLFSYLPASFQQGFLSGVPTIRSTCSLPGPFAELFPLDRAWGFGADIVNHPRHAVYFVYDAGGDTFQYFPGQPDPVRRHGVIGFHHSHRHGQPVGSPVAHHPHAPHGEKHRKCLPHLVIQPGTANLLNHDCVSLPESYQMWTGDFPKQPDGQPRPRKRVFHQDFFRQAQLLANPANLVLKEVPQRLDQPKRHLFRQSADVMVRFDGRGGPLHGNGLDPVRIKGPLHQVTNLAMGFPSLELLRFFRKDSDELFSDALALFLGVRNPFQLSEKAFRSVNANY